MRRLLPAVALVALLAIACFPGPDEPLEYLQREDTVVIQLRRVPAGAEAQVLPPELTLYGDGTVIYRAFDDEGDAGALLQTRLPAGVVRDLLEFAVDRGFLDFFYDQSVDVDAEAVPVVYETFLYVNTRAGTNSVRAVGLEVAVEEPATTVLEIVQRLRALDPEAEGASAPVEFVAERLILSAEAVDAFEGAGSPIIWPFVEIDLGTVAAGGDLVVEGDEIALDLAGVLAPAPFATTVQQDGRLFDVSFQPLLPFEEHFPEFD